jgi:hypothetical protein
MTTGPDMPVHTVGHQKKRPKGGSCSRPPA